MAVLTAHVEKDVQLIAQLLLADLEQPLNLRQLLLALSKLNREHDAAHSYLHYLAAIR